MKKVKLNLDSLAVESFEAIAESGVLRGTVRGNSRESLFAPENTCGDSCLDPNSCFGTCFCTYDSGC
jgi:hypothetical protein